LAGCAPGLEFRIDIERIGRTRIPLLEIKDGTFQVGRAPVVLLSGVRVRPCEEALNGRETSIEIKMSGRNNCSGFTMTLLASFLL
jgi:hypothetical protein